jgi:hypothetical protein
MLCFSLTSSYTVWYMEARGPSPETQGMSAAAECVPHCHVWRREYREVGIPIPPTESCKCRELEFGTLPQGARYRTEYRRSTGEILLNHLSVKSDR